MSNTANALGCCGDWHLSLQRRFTD